jgi:U3 small nucleolar ribonucleoprotein protein IMP4
MEVTTSRKPAPFLRTFSKDLAFALGGHYTPRGKSGLDGITGIDSVVLVVSKQKGYYLLEIFEDGEPVEGLAVSSFQVGKREGDIVRGVQVGNQTVYDNLKQYLNVSKTDCGDSTAIFDGVQRRRYVLSLKNAV